MWKLEMYMLVIKENVWYNEVIIYDDMLNINEMFIYIDDVNEDVYITVMNKGEDYMLRNDCELYNDEN